MRIVCVGVNHKTAPVELRERIAFSHIAADRALHQLHDRWPAAEFLLLSTCNRTELYTARELHGRPREQDLWWFLSEFHALPAVELQDVLYSHGGREAVVHFFRVVSGLDSLVPGEPQIVSQVKNAAAQAAEAGPLGSCLRNLFDEALHVAKHVRSETGIAEGRASVASVAMDTLTKTLGDLGGKTLLSVGGGKMNEILLQQIRSLQPKEVIVCNRSMDRAVELAEGCEARVADFLELPRWLQTVDVVVTSTGAGEPIITPGMLDSRPQGRPLLVLDLAVPRDTVPAVGQLPGVTVRNIDDLQAVVNRTLQGRSAHLDRAGDIVEKHADAFMDATNVREVTPTLEALYERMETVIDEETAEAANKFSTHEDGEEDMEILRRSLRRVLRKLCHPAAENLRRQAAAGHGARAADILRTLFDLDRNE